MYEIGTDRLHQLFVEARAAAKYAREHYDALACRPSTHTLYGPQADAIGASVPSKITPLRSRKLLKSTRRRNYIIYELDEAYHVLRTIHVLDYVKYDCTYHHFELNKVFYAYPFRGNGRELFNDEIIVLKYSADKPIYFGIVSNNLLFAQFYEYLSSDKMIVTTYRYWPSAKRNQHGYLIDRKAPIDAMNSPVTRHCSEETPEYIDFSNWFK